LPGGGVFFGIKCKFWTPTRVRAHGTASGHKHTGFVSCSNGCTLNTIFETPRERVIQRCIGEITMFRNNQSDGMYRKGDALIWIKTVKIRVVFHSRYTTHLSCIIFLKIIRLTVLFVRTIYSLEIQIRLEYLKREYRKRTRVRNRSYLFLSVLYNIFTVIVANTFLQYVMLTKLEAWPEKLSTNLEQRSL